jgi:hypothetical protein
VLRLIGSLSRRRRRERSKLGKIEKDWKLEKSYLDIKTCALTDVEYTDWIHSLTRYCIKPGGRSY